jgi:hypothetical protein
MATIFRQFLQQSSRKVTELYTEIICVIYAILPSCSFYEYACFINLLVPALNLKKNTIIQINKLGHLCTTMTTALHLFQRHVSHSYIEQVNLGQ